MEIRRLGDGCQTKRNVLHESISHHCLEHFYSVEGYFQLQLHRFESQSQTKCDKRTFVQKLCPSNPAIRPWIEIKSQRVTACHLEAKVTTVYLSRETRNENSSQTSDFYFENLSSLQSFVSR